MYSLAFTLLQQDIEGLEASWRTVILVALLVGLAIYAFVAFCFMKIAEKTGTDNGWWAWIPILNILLMLKIADRPMWWIILFFVPILSFIIFLVVFADICKACDKSPWLTVGMLIPLVNIGVVGYLAFSD